MKSEIQNVYKHIHPQRILQEKIQAEGSKPFQTRLLQNEVIKSSSLYSKFI